jgi:hypothetical protein
MKASQSINKTQKTLKEKTKMKKTTLTTLFILTISFIFSTASYAADHSNHYGFHNATSYLAEKEIRTKEQKAAKNNEVHVAINASAADDKEKGYLHNSEEIGSTDKKEQH